MRAWRYGAPWETELDSLADRLIHDEPLRRNVLSQPGARLDEAVARRVREWRERCRRLAETQGRTYGEQLAKVIERALEYEAARSQR